jgi:hypothetical protein
MIFFQREPLLGCRTPHRSGDDFSGLLRFLETIRFS